jgi:PAS domain S-box-containing protein
MPPLAGGLYAPLLAPPRGGRGFLDLHRSAAGPLVIGFSVPVFGVQQDPGQARPLGRIVGLRRAEEGIFPLLRQPGFAWKSADIYLVRRTDGAIEYLSPRHGDRAPLTGARQAYDRGLAAADAVRGVRFGIADTYAGEPSVFAARALSAAPWTVIASVARDEALGPAEARRITTIAALLAAIAVAVVAIVAVWRHGTSLRAAEAASRYHDMAHRYEAQSRFLRLVADSQPHPMFIVDGEGRFRFANRAAAEQAETSDADMIGKSLASVLGPAEARRYEETNREVMSSRAMQSRIHRSGSNGDLRVVQSEYIPVADGPDFDDGILIVEQDITRAISEREHRMAALRQLVRTLLAAVDSRDPYAANHSMQVAVVARAVAEEMGLDDVEVETAEIAGSLMNVGKLLVPTDLLTRPGQLSADELGRVRDAIDAGVALLADVPFEGPVVETLRQMGERWDGAGQPRGLSGTEILATARIVAIANAFVAMLNPRAWRPGCSLDDAVEALLDAEGAAFDRSVVGPRRAFPSDARRVRAETARAPSGISPVVEPDPCRGRLRLRARRHQAGPAARRAGGGRRALDPRRIPRLARRSRPLRRPRSHHHRRYRRSSQPDRHRHRRVLQRQADLPRPRRGRAVGASDLTPIMAGAADLWPAILDPAWMPPGGFDPAAAAEAAARLEGLVASALAKHLLANAERRLGADLVAPEAARQSRLINRLNGEHQRRWMARIAAEGPPVVVMKGFVFAHTLYPDPDIRTIGDLDVLVRRADRDRLLDLLQQNGFAFERLPSSAWGFISDASYQPMMSADGNCNIDVHVQPDCYPAYRSLDTERLFAAAHPLDIDGVGYLAPAPAHALVLCLTNAAKDKFGPYSVRKLIDVAVLLRDGDAIDWPEVRHLLSAGGFEAPARVAFALLVRLGFPEAAIPADLRAAPSGLRGGAFEKLVRDYRSLFAADPSPMTVLARELLLCTQPATAIHNALLRFRGLFRPRDGIPEGYRARS